MLHIPKINDYLKILAGDEVKDFVAINFSEYFKSISQEQNLRKVDKSLYNFLTTPDEVEKYVQSNPSDNYIHHYNVEILNSELQLIKTKPVIKNKPKEFLNELKMFEVQKVLVLDHKKRNDCKIFHSDLPLLLLIQTLTKQLYPCIKAS